MSVEYDGADGDRPRTPVVSPYARQTAIHGQDERLAAQSLHVLSSTFEAVGAARAGRHAPHMPGRLRARMRPRSR